MPRIRYWLAMYFVLTLAVMSGVYLGGRLLISHQNSLYEPLTTSFAVPTPNGLRP
jgi:hypothetical protein